ncbi:Phage Tail Protein X [compost metagenome]
MSALVSVQGERWDALCQRAYGSVTQQSLDTLRAANVGACRLTVGFVLPPGLVITVPPLERGAITPVEIAPWQR